MRHKKTAIKLVMVAAIMLAFPMVAYATGIENTVLFTGSKNLLQDLTKGLTAISAVVTVFLSIFRCVLWQCADDQDKPHKKKAVQNTVLIGILITCMSGLIAFVLSYYGGTTP
jgi:ABC-type phosphate/phosphonate transport system permease subunit